MQYLVPWSKALEKVLEDLFPSNDTLDPGFGFWVFCLYLFAYLFGARIQFFTMYDLKFHLPNIWPRETSEKEFQLLVPKSTTVAKTILYVYTNGWAFPDHMSERSDDSSEK